MKKVLFIGELFATGRKDGIPRYTEEIIKAMDRMNTRYDMELIVPCPVDIELDNIKVIVLNEKRYRSGKLGGEIWRQYDIVNYARKNNGIMVDLGMVFPFFRNDICAIHDCQPEKYQGNYLRGKHSGLRDILRMRQRRNAARKSKLIVTVSKNSAKEIVQYFGVDSSKIRVVYNAWQHYEKVQADESVFNDYPVITEKPYFFSLGSRFKHKNIEWVYAAARQNPQYQFVITGYDNVAQYSNDIVSKAPENCLFTGYLSDEKIKALMRGCRAFIFPSLSEGFGIPPLEALSVGAELIISNASCLPEVYGDCAHYIDPNNYENIDLDEILKGQIGDGQAVLDKYSWEKSAKALLKCIEEIS